MSHSISIYALLAGALGVLIYNLYNTFTSQAKVPAELPWIGNTSKGLFSELRASIDCLIHARERLSHAYENYLRRGKSYVYPSLGGNSEIVVPNDKVQWLANNSDTSLSPQAAHYDMLAGAYAFTDPAILRQPFHETVVHHNMARKIGQLIPSTWDEVKFQLDDTFGSDTEEWKDFGVLEAMTAIIAGVSNRMLVGLPLCRNSKFCELNKHFAGGVMFAVILLQLCPKWFQPIVGHLASIPNHICVWRVKKHVLPLVNQQLASIKNEDPSKPLDDESSETFIAWQIRAALSRNNPEESNPDRVIRRLMALEFAAIHTSTFTVANIILDLAASDPSLGYIEALREEAERIYSECGGQWTKKSLASMIRTDSAIRESMRVSCFGMRGMHAKVVNPLGLESPEGWTAPFGATISTDVYTRHHDPEIYPEPYAYDALRFSREREKYEEKSEEERSPGEYLRLQNLSMISTGESFLSFGHGRHACPGRFFINLEMKLLLAYLVMNYDFQYTGPRTPNEVKGEIVLPPAKATVRLRRRVRERVESEK